jgi:hypothetical protein
VSPYKIKKNSLKLSVKDCERKKCVDKVLKTERSSEAALFEQRTEADLKGAAEEAKNLRLEGPCATSKSVELEQIGADWSQLRVRMTKASECPEVRS